MPLIASAAEVAEGLLGMFTRTGFPLRVLTDQGMIFMGKVINSLCKTLGIDTIHTTPYRPQTNADGTLKPVLVKAKKEID